MHSSLGKILPGRQKGDGKGRNMTAASKNREEAMQMALRGRGEAGRVGEDAKGSREKTV